MGDRSGGDGAAGGGARLVVKLYVTSLRGGWCVTNEKVGIFGC